MRALSFALAVPLLLSSPAFAQDGSEGVTQRTVESAQQFLAELQRKYGADIQYAVGTYVRTSRDDRGRWRTPEQWGTRTLPDDYIEHQASWEVARLEPVQRCVTRVHLTAGSQVVLQGGDESARPLPPASLPPQGFIDVDWSRVETVGWSNSYAFRPGLGFKLTLPPSAAVLKSGWAQLGFRTNDTQIYTRAQAAAQFLKEYCTPSTQTGF